MLPNDREAKISQFADVTLLSSAVIRILLNRTYKSLNGLGVSPDLN